MPGVLLTPVSPWQPAQPAAAALPACTGSGLARRGLGACGRAGLRRLEARVVGGHLDQRVVAQELDRAVHGARCRARRPGTSRSSQVEVRGALAGEMRHALGRADAVRAVATRRRSTRRRACLRRRPARSRRRPAGHRRCRAAPWPAGRSRPLAGDREAPTEHKDRKKKRLRASFHRHFLERLSAIFGLAAAAMRCGS